MTRRSLWPWSSVAGAILLAALLAAAVPGNAAAGTAGSQPDSAATVASLRWETTTAEVSSTDTSSAATPSAVTALPSLCHLNREYFGRFADCFYTTWSGILVNAKTGVPVGSVAGTAALWNSLAYNSRSWQEHIRLAITSATGEAAAATVIAPIACSSGSTACVPSGQGVGTGEDEFLAVRPSSDRPRVAAFTSMRP
jgi:hypothetical protein